MKIDKRNEKKWRQVNDIFVRGREKNERCLYLTMMMMIMIKMMRERITNLKFEIEFTNPHKHTQRELNR